MKYLKKFTILTFILIYISQPAFAIKVTAVGQGVSRPQAIKDAQRNAIEQALGTYIKSDSKVSMGQLNHDLIISKSSGYIKEYDVLDEGSNPIDNSYMVKLRVIVNERKLKVDINNFFTDAKAKKSFHNNTFDNRRVIVSYKKNYGGSLSPGRSAVQTLMDLVEDELVGYGFRVFLESELKRIKGKATDLMVDEASRIQFARQENADALVLVSIDAKSRNTSDGYLVISGAVSLKSYDITTGEIIANLKDNDKTITMADDYVGGVTRVAEKIGRPAVKKLVTKIVNRFTGHRSKFVTLMIRDVSLSTQEKLEDLFDEKAWEYRVASQTGKYMELEFFSEFNPTEFRKKFRRAIKKKKIHLKPVDFKGARITYSGKYK